ncbi:probable S-adenosylmethionine synthase 4 [Colius striatus]|uniref:probable S-adenosylmethionine synthase 4 n=1 Tax=Colius striatus TaxID=57412 RepID=UPI002B1D9FB5|nr:probable S-adenosylmethionine synthase 4 [Colius striatus]
MKNNFFLPQNLLLKGILSESELISKKTIVDTYGGWGACGAGAFFGKDPSKVVSSAACAARWITKSLVKVRLYERVLIQGAGSEEVNLPKNSMLWVL